MKISAIHVVYFSATGNTALVSSRFSDYLGAKLNAPVEKDDFTLPGRRDHERQYTENDLVVFAVPTYAGRVPNKVLPFIQTLFHGNGALAIPVVTFGNRSSDSALPELRNELEKDGFHAIAAASITCRHAFADIGTSRPNSQDFDLLKDLAAKVSSKIEALADASSAPHVKIGDEAPVAPYYTPLRTDGQPAKFLKAKPLTNKKKCNDCGRCAEVCPMGSISFENTDEVPGICIKCQACIRECPQHAKYFDDPDFLSHKEYLEKNYRRAAESAVFCI
ncbi:MAG: EFR1 family ferrodoxin [Eubacteriales bacterium]|jgi:ferredoxin/flavodoxin